ncbi:YncE family protein [Streptomyces kaempferi]
MSPNGTRAYVTNSNADTVSVIKTATNTVVATIPVGDAPREVAVSPDGTRAYVTNASADTVSVINTATNTVVATIPVGDLPFGVAIGVVPCPGHGKPGHGKPDHGKPGHGKPGHDRPTTATAPAPGNRTPA